jgi:hypothetical protein
MRWLDRGRHWLGRSPLAVACAVSATRLARISGTGLDDLLQDAPAAPAGGDRSHRSRAPGSRSSAAARSSGTTRSSTASSRVQASARPRALPSYLAPGGSGRPHPGPAQAGPADGLSRPATHRQPGAPFRCDPPTSCGTRPQPTLMGSGGDQAAEMLERIAVECRPVKALKAVPAAAQTTPSSLARAAPAVPRWRTRLA